MMAGKAKLMADVIEKSLTNDDHEGEPFRIINKSSWLLIHNALMVSCKE